MMKPIFVRHNRKLIRIEPGQVIGLSSEKNYTKIFLSNLKIYMVRTTMTNALKKLPPDMFVMLSRSFAASVNYIDEISRDHLVLAGQPEPIAKSYYDSLVKKLTIVE